MKYLCIKDILKICDGELLCGDENLICEDFSNDTRTIKPGDIYIGIKGENFNGNNLYKEAIKKGAKACILESDTRIDINDSTIILVKSTIDALGKMAEYKLSKYNIPVIAITGSVGKTSAKDIIASVISKKYKTLKTASNFNNHIGLPLTILKLKDHEALVLEMGMNHFDEISYLSNIAKPDIAVITNVGTSHIGNLGSRENILKAKLEILEGLKDNGTLIINNDNDLLYNIYNHLTKDYNVITVGIDNNSDIYATNINITDSITCEINDPKNKLNVNIHIDNKNFIYNAMIAYAVGKKLNIEDNLIKEGINSFELTKNRMEKFKIKDNVTIISDCYNASLEAVKGSLETLSNYKDRKIAVLGDMLELGEYSEEIHREVGKIVEKNKIDILITVGNMSRYIALEANKGLKEVYTFDNNLEAIECLKQIVKSNDNILIKASNSMKFIEIVDALKTVS